MTLEHQGGTILRLRSDPPIARRKQDANVRASPSKLITLPMPNDLDMQVLGFRYQLIECCARRPKTQPKFARAKISQHCGHPSNVVGVSVSNCDRVQPRDAALPEIRRDDTFAKIELLPARSNRPARIDQQRVSLRHNQQR